MASNTSIPIIVQGNSFALAIPLQIYVIDDNEMVLQDYTPDPTDEVSIQLKGSRRNYTYTPTIDGNVANINLGGYELADNYAVVVSIVKANGQRLRSFRSDQFFIVESSDDLTQDDIIAGLEENVIYLNAQAFIAGADGRGIQSILKTGTSGLVDTYTIYYSDNTTSTFDVTNGAQGAQGVGITSIEKTSTSGLVDTYTITLSNGNTSTFEVTNGKDGVDLGLANVVNDLVTGGTTDVLSAEMGKKLGQGLALVTEVLKNSVFTSDQSANLEALEDMFGGVYVVTKSLTNVTISPDIDVALAGDSLSITFTASASHVIDSAVVTMGGVSQSVTIAQDNKTATCSIASVSGDIAITASASYVEQDLIDSATKVTGHGVVYNQKGNYGASSSYDCFIVPVEFGKWYRLSGYDWAAKGGTNGGFNLALVKSDGNGGFENIKTTELTASIFTKNNSIWDITNTNNNIYMQTASNNNSSTYMFATPTSSELSGVNDIYIAVNIKFSSVDISDDVSLFAYKPKETYSASDVVKYYGLVYSSYDLGRNANLYYDCVVIKATKGATYSYSGDNWSAQSGNGQGFAIGLAKGVGDLFDNLTASDFASGASWLSNDSFFNHTANIFKASVAESGQFTIPTDADLSSSQELYIVINTRFVAVDVSSNLTLTKQ